MDRAKHFAWLAREAKRCRVCGTTPDMWVDENGETYRIPRYEVVVDYDPGCAEIGHRQAEFSGQLPKDPIAAQHAMAGVVFRIVPFDPRRELRDMAAMMPPETQEPPPSLADPIVEGGRILTPDS